MCKFKKGDIVIIKKSGYPAVWSGMQLAGSGKFAATPMTPEDYLFRKYFREDQVRAVRPQDIQSLLTAILQVLAFQRDEEMDKRDRNYARYKDGQEAIFRQKYSVHPSEVWELPFS